MTVRDLPAEAFPLYWPEGWPRTKSRKRAAFQVTFGRAAAHVADQLRQLGLHYVVSTNIPIRRDGLPYAGQADPADPGVAVYWRDSRGQAPRCMACDKWTSVAGNLRAIGLSLEALRGLSRWGSSEIVERAFTGFSALPPAPDDWRATFGLARVPMTLDEVRTKYRELARTAHPDHGGSPHEMVRLNAAMAAAEAELSR